MSHEAGEHVFTYPAIHLNVFDEFWDENIFRHVQIKDAGHGTKWLTVILNEGGCNGGGVMS